MTKDGDDFATALNGNVPKPVKVALYVVKEIGVPGFIALYLIFVLTGIVPSPQLRAYEQSVRNEASIAADITESRLAHEKMITEFGLQMSHQNRILRAICNQGAKTDVSRAQCDPQTMRRKDYVE